MTAENSRRLTEFRLKLVEELLVISVRCDDDHILERGFQLLLVGVAGLPWVVVIHLNVNYRCQR